MAVQHHQDPLSLGIMGLMDYPMLLFLWLCLLYIVDQKEKKN
jgi:hypothetical protein